MVANTLVKVRKRKYINTGDVLILIHYFYVSKGDDGIQILYNRTNSDINDSLWVPHFELSDV